MFEHGFGQLIAIVLAGLLGHADAAERIDTALQGPGGLQANDELELAVEIARRIVGQGRDRGGVDVEHAAQLELQRAQPVVLGIEQLRSFRRRGEERLVA